MFQYTYNSPIGELLITYNNTHILGLHFDKSPTLEHLHNDIIHNCKAQLDAYFSGDLKDFDLPLHTPGTAFQQATWRALTQIPYGKTLSYKGMAEAINNPKAARAIGNANNKNPIAVIIPCHRVITHDGGLGGFGGGLDKKIWLLEHEKNSLS
ncbi:MAG: methylated-DNA--[protein]-cysteine S-methyltransferase [Defluviitaleaceae bacterium]|nr:methylated-DNA--[protein]-cysteine S-methyltransferase [Defluviitaleaceae bacterium]